MTDPFSKHGIQHLSVSSLSLWRNEPARWVARYLYGVKDEGGPRAWRGNAVEAGLNQALAGAADDEAIEAALQNLDRAIKDDVIRLGTEVPDERHNEYVAEWNNVPDMVRLVAANLRPLGRPLTTQRRVERRLPGIEVPIIGYVDYEWDDFIVDLKTTLRMPSAPRGDHAVQVVHYGDALGKRPGLIYVTPKKIQRFAEEHIDVAEARWTLRRAALALRITLQVAADREEMANLTIPKFDDYRWNPASIEAAKAIWR